MSSTQFRQGYNESKPTSRVLKPPGGGSSNIFGAPEPIRAPPSSSSSSQSKSNRSDSNVLGQPNITSPAAKTPEKPDTQNTVWDVKKTTSPPTPKAHETLYNPITGSPTRTARHSVIPIVEPQPKGPSQDPNANKAATTEAPAKGPSEDVNANKGAETTESSSTNPDTQPATNPHARKVHPSTRVLQPPGGHCHRLW